MLVNLLNNAVQAMPDGGRLTVTTRLIEQEIDGEYQEVASVYVSDSGMGIPADNLARRCRLSARLGWQGFPRRLSRFQH